MVVTKEEILSYHDLSWLRSWIKSHPSELVLLFGSFIQKKENARDIDLLIVSNIFKGSYYHMRRNIFNIPSETKHFIDVFCYTFEEFSSLFSKDHPLLKSLLSDYITLSGDVNVIRRNQ